MELGETAARPELFHHIPEKAVEPFGVLSLLVELGDGLQKGVVEFLVFGHVPEELRQGTLVGQGPPALEENGEAVREETDPHRHGKGDPNGGETPSGYERRRGQNQRENQAVRTVPDAADGVAKI